VVKWIGILIQLMAQHQNQDLPQPLPEQDRSQPIPDQNQVKIVWV